MSWPTGTFSTQYLDGSLDDPEDARVDLLAQAQAANDMIAALNAADGVLGLDSASRYAAANSAVPATGTARVNIASLPKNTTSSVYYVESKDTYGFFDLTRSTSRIFVPALVPRYRFVQIGANLQITVTTAPASATILYLRLRFGGNPIGNPVFGTSIDVTATGDYSIGYRSPRLNSTAGQSLSTGFSGSEYFDLVFYHADSQMAAAVQGTVFLQVVG